MRNKFLWLPIIFIIILVTVTFIQTNHLLYAESNNSGKSYEKATSEQLANGENIFNDNCMACHANGGNIMNPAFPLRGSQKLTNFKTFLTFIRNPHMPDGSTGSMPSFPDSSIPNDVVKELYNYLVSEYSMNSSH